MSCYTGTVERLGEYILEKIVFVGAFQELIVGQAVQFRGGVGSGRIFG